MLLGIPFKDRLCAFIVFTTILIIMLGYYKVTEYKMDKSKK